METIKTSAEMIGLIHDFKTQKRISRFCREQGILWRGLKESDRNRPVAAILYGKIPEAMQPLLPQALLFLPLPVPADSAFTLFRCFLAAPLLRGSRSCTCSCISSRGRSCPAALRLPAV